MGAASEKGASSPGENDAEAEGSDGSGEAADSGLSRRRFLGGGLALGGALLLPGCPQVRRLEDRLAELPGELVGGSAERGHGLRTGALRRRRVQSSSRVSVLIIGGGAAGFSAAWRLRRAGFKSYRILELEDALGGTARSGRNEVSGYPWGAHYLPTPPSECRGLRVLLRELGVLVGEDREGRPVYNTRYICRAPVERLFVDGMWVSGLWPEHVAGVADRRELGRFQKICEKWTAWRDGKGRKAFTLPIAQTSPEEEPRALDKLSMAEWFKAEGFTSEVLRWWLEYGSRDDYGSRLEDVSAWSMLHYHTARSGEGDELTLTWPEGNGWLLGRLAAGEEGRTSCGRLVYRLARRSGGGWRAWAWDASGDRVESIDADQVVFAAPKFLAPFIIDGLDDAARSRFSAYTYSPWLIANLTVKGDPGGLGEGLCWDNVFYRSPSLGYVNAGHLAKPRKDGRRVLTYYLPLTDSDPRVARRRLLAGDRRAWLGLIFEDLLAVHPELLGLVERVDLYRWGHGMARPRPGFIWGDRLRLPNLAGLSWAGADCGGLPLFEEANDSGVRAAEEVLAARGLRFESLR